MRLRYDRLYLLHGDERCLTAVLPVIDVSRSLPKAVVLGIEDLDPIDPLDPPDAVPPRNYHSNGGAMEMAERFSVECPGNDRVARDRLLPREALGEAAFHGFRLRCAAVPSLHEHALCISEGV